MASEPPFYPVPGTPDPGAPPYLRGIHRDMYAGRPWTMRQYAGFGTAQETNARYRLLLEGGQTGLSVAFDLPTQMGLDSDDPRALGEVGRTGVAIDTVEDMEILFAGIPLGEVSISMTINAPAAILWAMLIVVARRQGVPPEALRGTVQNDILKEYVARGTYIFPPGPSMRLVADTLRYGEGLPLFNPISVSGYHLREAGATAAQEVGITLSHGLSYLAAAQEAGVGVEGVARRLSFFFGAHNDLFEEVGKFRAARALWHDLLTERFGVEDPKALRLRFHTQTCGSTLTRNQPLLNIARVALQALAATLGGTQSLHTNSYDEAIGLPGEEAALMALRTQQVLLHETGLARAADPLGGAPFIEAETARVRAGAEEVVALVDKAGGGVAAVVSGLTASLVHDSAWRHQQAMEEGSKVVVGVNRHVEGAAEPPPPAPRPEAAREEQVAALAQRRAGRDQAALGAGLAALEESARGEGPLMEGVIAAVEAGASVGEVCGRFASVWGRHGALSG